MVALAALGIFGAALQTLRKFDGIEAETWGVGSPFVVVEERPVQVAGQGHALGADFRHFVDVQAQKLAAGHTIPSLVVLGAGPPA